MRGWRRKSKLTAAGIGLLALLRADAQDYEPPRNRSGTVKLNIVDAYGHGLRPTEIRITSSSGESFSAEVSKPELRALPYGDYKLRVLVPGFRYWEYELHLQQPLLQLTAGMRLGSLDGPAPSCSLRGQLTGIDTSHERFWIRLLPVFGNEFFESDVTDAGQFMLLNVECGDYVAAVMKGHRLLNISSVTITGTERTISFPIGKQGR